MRPRPPEINMTTAPGINTMRRLIPGPIKRAVKDAMLDLTFRRAVRKIRELPPGASPNRELLNDLIVGWGNEGFCAQVDYLEEVSRQAVKTAGPILECGSGLTTILLGLLAGRRGIDTWSLEHYSAWRTRVRQALQQFDIPNVQVCLAPLQSLSDFDWYDAPLDEMPPEFRLVICDGPPGSTAGGRYGLLPLMRDRLPGGSVILLDDAARAGETEVLQRWTREANLHVSYAGAFALITRV
jgi:hypothetical protein